MKEFKSWKSYHQFKLSVTRHNRYIFNSDVKDFLQTVLETGKSRIEIIKEGSILWRSQLGCDNENDNPCAFEPERMKPSIDSACEGRANPKGIPYLYLSTHYKTAMSEVRPWVGSYLSLAKFKLSRNVRLVNCTSDSNGTRIYLQEPTPEKREISVWKDIDTAFSMPVSLNDTTADYAPTQIIAELFKNNGFDGIAYRSSLGEGHNIMLFSLDIADQVDRTLCNFTRIPRAVHGDEWFWGFGG
jgi:hypothetical protein